MNIRTFCPIRTLLIASAAFVLGCAATPEPRIDTEGVDEAQLRDDLADCDALARDAEIDGEIEVPGEDRPVAGGDMPGDPQPAGTAGPGDTRVVTEAQQRQHIVESCMVERGYRLLN